MCEGETPQIRFDLPFSEAKTLWDDWFYAVYTAHAMERAGGNITHAAKISDIDRKYFRYLYRKYANKPSALDTTQDVEIAPEPETVVNENLEYAKWRRRFYNGINFKRGMIAYLYFNGERTTREGVRKVSMMLGGWNISSRWGQYGHWNSLQIHLTQIGILVSMRDYCIYDWNDALVPTEYKDALKMKQDGKSIDEILAIYHLEVAE